MCHVSRSERFPPILKSTLILGSRSNSTWNRWRRLRNWNWSSRRSRWRNYENCTGNLASPSSPTSRTTDTFTTKSCEKSRRVGWWRTNEKKGAKLWKAWGAPLLLITGKPYRNSRKHTIGWSTWHRWSSKLKSDTLAGQGNWKRRRCTTMT